MKKLLVVGVIVLFLGLAIATVQPEEEIIDVDNKQKENILGGFNK